MKAKAVHFYLIAFIILSWIILEIAPYTTQNNEFAEILAISRLAYLFIEILLAVKILQIYIKSEFATRTKNLILSTVAVVVVLIVLEGVFMFIPRSHGSGGKNCLAAMLWHSKYWSLNKLGYRDPEIDFPAVENKFKIMVVGDSFITGAGIKNTKDRFSNLLQEKLRTNYTVFNLGINGADTKMEYSRLVQFPLKPDLIILAHYPNDIEHVVPEITTELDSNADLPINKAHVFEIPILQEVFGKSYLINYFYWKFKAIAKSRLEKQDQTGIEYYSKEKAKDHYLAFYLKQDLLRKHLQNLYQFVLLSREESIPLMVILFPENWNSVIDYSGSSVNEPLEKFFSNQGVPVMNIYSLIKSIPLEKRIVNANDSHPSELMHQKVAEALHTFLTESKLVN